MPNTVSNADIREYYQECHSALGEGWLQNTHQAIHVGYFETGDESHSEAMEKMTEKAADAADIGPGDRVLDAGCGVGGPAMWLAENRDADVVGINITDDQLEIGRDLAAERGLADQTTFKNDDLTEMASLEDDSFDVVWAIEAVCYAEDTSDFIREAKRVLKDGGRIVVADGYRSRHWMTPDEKESYEIWTNGWSLPGFDHVDDFTDSMAEYGFTDLSASEITDKVDRSSRLMFIKGLFWPLAWTLNRVNVWSDTKKEHYIGCYHQRKMYTQGVCKFYLISAQLSE